MQSNVNVNENAPAAADSGRNGKGQFQLGNKGGPGNPFAGQVAAFRQAVLEHVSAADIADIIKGLVEMAKNGHWQAAKLILQYALGKPQPLPDPDLLPTMMYEADSADPPSTNGFFQDEPSTNGSCQEAPSTNGVFEESPSTNGDLQDEAPSTNGILQESPSTNGILPSTNGEIEPGLNRKQRRALKKAKRLAKKMRNSPPPVPHPAAPVPVS